jgi:RNA polymerase sigma-70 factor (ECF subfamily)
MAVADADALYEEATATYGAALERLARAYEADADRRRDLIQDLHLALWRSFARFDGRCSLRTWVYRVAHNTATSQVIRRRSRAPALVGLDDLDSPALDARAADVSEADAVDRDVDDQRALERLLQLIQRLKPLDRQVILLYLEEMDAAAIGEVTGLSAGNVATKVHRIKKILTRRFHEGGRDGQ